MKYQLSIRSFILPTILGAVVSYFSQNFLLGIGVFCVLLLPEILKIYIPYAKDNPKHYWFKRKMFGWGWTPVTWEGWLIMLAYIAVILLLVLRLDESANLDERLWSFIIPAIPISVIFFAILYKKGESPKWQWGIKDEEQNH